MNLASETCGAVVNRLQFHFGKELVVYNKTKRKKKTTKKTKTNEQ